MYATYIFRSIFYKHQHGTWNNFFFNLLWKMVHYLDDEDIFIDSSAWSKQNSRLNGPGRTIYKDFEDGKRYYFLSAPYHHQVKFYDLTHVKKVALLLREKEFPEFVGIVIGEKSTNNIFKIFVVLNFPVEFDYAGAWRYIEHLLDGTSSRNSFNGIELMNSEDVGEEENVITFNTEDFQKLRDLVLLRSKDDDDESEIELKFTIDLRPLQLGFTTADWEQFCFALYYFGSVSYFKFIAKHRGPPKYLSCSFTTYDSFALKTTEQLFQLEAIFTDLVLPLLWYHEELPLQQVHEEVESNSEFSRIITAMREDLILQKARRR